MKRFIPRIHPHTKALAKEVAIVTATYVVTYVVVFTACVVVLSAIAASQEKN
jgi:hypothetical protein